MRFTGKLLRMVPLGVILTCLPLVSAQTVIYDLPAFGGNVFPGQDGRLTADDAQLGGTERVADSISIPVAALGNGTADVTAFLYEDSGAGPGDLLWQGTYLAQPFSAAPGTGDFQTFTWNMVNTPVPNNIYWGVRFANVSDSITAIGPREGAGGLASPAPAFSSDQVLYVQPSGSTFGTFTQFDFFIDDRIDIPDNLAVNITATSLRPVPEPRVLGLLLFGGIALMLLRRRRAIDEDGKESIVSNKT